MPLIRKKGGIAMIIPVLSFDPQKVQFLFDGEMIVRKRTSFKEYEHMVLASKYLSANPICVPFPKLRVRVAPIVSWSSSELALTTVFCCGQNGEIVLRRSVGRKRIEWIKLFKQFLLAIRRVGFLWGDCAPRHLIVDVERGQLLLVDFERDTRFLYGPSRAKQFSRYISGYAREEFSCFLTIDEQRDFFDGILAEERNEHVSVSVGSVKSKRKVGLLINLFGEKQVYSMGELRQIEDLMAFIATPFEMNGKMFFPMDALDKISSEKGVGAYVSIAIKLRSTRSVRERFRLFNDVPRIG